MKQQFRGQVKDRGKEGQLSLQGQLQSQQPGFHTVQPLQHGSVARSAEMSSRERPNTQKQLPYVQINVKPAEGSKG